VARFQRMRGKEVFYPIGWDDNGLPTERRVQNYYGVTCDPHLPYQPDLVPPGQNGQAGGSARRPAGRLPVSRRNFVELCWELTQLDERAYAEAWRRLGLSVDWSTSYRTVEDKPSAIGQRAFLRALADGSAYQAQGPVLWDPTFRTAVAQAEVEDRDVAGSYWRLAFGLPDGELVIATTRPELLPACVALVAHPHDDRYRHLFGQHARTPLFGVSVPVLAHHLADPAKGTGIAMVCTFGDTTDVTWWRDLRLETRPVIGQDGRLLAVPPEAIASAAGQAAYAELAGLSVRTARKRATELLGQSGQLRGAPEPVTHQVKFYEYGDTPLEIITARQWYVRNGGNDEALRELLLARGAELTWHPAHMQARYDNWVRGLAGDWLISRQRYFGVPIPVWYPVREDGTPDYERPILPADHALPVDPAADQPPGFDEAQRDVPGGFTGDLDVMDTWATSSLTPQIVGGWSTDDDLYARVFPMDLRPQAHEIIRTWLFYTVLRSQVLHGALPWRHAAISGWILDPDRKKMSKSVGNVVTPTDLLHEYGTDAVRYWAASARLGVDTAFDVAQLKIGRRLAIKILNATRFVLGFDQGDPDQPVSEPLDLAMLDRLADLVRRCTAALDDYDHALALDLAEQFFWLFCDDYLELVKPRAYAADRDPAAAGSAVTALRLALSVLLRLLAPALPFVTEEAWSWWCEGSIHRAPWPDPDLITQACRVGAEGPGSVSRSGAIALEWRQVDSTSLDAASSAIAAIRKAKSEMRLGMRAPVSRLAVTGPGRSLDALRPVLADVMAAGHAADVDLRTVDDAEMRYEVTF
jgi:valyl-tRNA synthetase